MFVCRSCRSQQRRLFSTTKAAFAEAKPAATIFDDTMAKLRERQQSSRPPSATARELQSRREGGLDAANRLLQRNVAGSVRDTAQSQESLAKLQAENDRADLARNMTRFWKEGDVYAPHDLSGAEMAKWKVTRAKGKQARDVCDNLQLNPLEHYKNFSMMSEYITEMGRIKGRSDTGLRPVNQRRMAKAIRRAVGCGLLPSVHRHPEILRIDMDREKEIMQRQRRR